MYPLQAVFRLRLMSSDRRSWQIQWAQEELLDSVLLLRLLMKNISSSFRGLRRDKMYRMRSPYKVMKQGLPYLYHSRWFANTTHLQPAACHLQLMFLVHKHLLIPLSREVALG
jgi:hypothetical protein